MKKTINIIKNIFVGALVTLSICMMIFTIISVTTFDRSDRSIFGYKAFVVLSDSMSATDFNAGDLAIMKEVDPSTLQVGDIIAYTSQNIENFGETVTHKIREITTDSEGNPGFITYGTSNDTNDETIVTYPYILGKYQISVPKVGMFFHFLKTKPGYIICIFIPFMIMILIQAMECIRIFKEYKREKIDEAQAERKKLEYELTETKRKMEELLLSKK